MRRGRFAPSPTGELHIGNAFTAVMAWLQMRSVGGDFVLRIEDIDEARCRSHYVAQVMEDLRWLGLDWDEGPDVGGAHGPYQQSARLPEYEAALHQLQVAGYLYPCFCSRAELVQVASAPHGLFADEPRYSGRCRHLTEAQRGARAQQKRPSLRFCAPDKEVVVLDRLIGETRVNPLDGGDFIVRRADGVFSYQLAVVVDDAAMEITDVLRGADLFSSAPRQISLYQALGRRPPTFTHVPLVVDAKGRRLSKRNRSSTVRAMRESGVAAEEIVGVISYLAGLSDSIRPTSPSELVERFDLTRLHKRPVQMDELCMRRLKIYETF
ncbi:tRNA glutamyl-Q(34) synthetase GluQRS [Alicyclobacillus fastidiosus]|uniref:Glutamyl-Q tRNA(Asp) synthetase n=1 Tax=Alicyclobacillus fastidiosus TaxID=392011 RepID=A0ABY6ZFH8_9BACL|nr:tRNA glutamyl-Q(34) synthetase GluQRS [Alicyclobacillus fastidiosus]WAH40971.1 tRNA glutamyl-Q(34) synthetase GluQRS [Alicyclobacillus fastidiosus]GMA62485.1 glutamyl-Q tRNA(Asp) synthetase [Alicyclobacillus fastidiosus]